MIGLVVSECKVMFCDYFLFVFLFLIFLIFFFFFFSSRRRHTRCSRDWSSDVCSSDLGGATGSWRCFSFACRTAPCEPAIVRSRGKQKRNTSMNQLRHRLLLLASTAIRSEERRVGKECKSHCERYHEKKTTKT